MKIMRYFESTLLQQTDFAIVSDNCWGYSLYKTIGRPYNTPFVGLYLQPAHYLRAISNLDDFLIQEITQINTRTINNLNFPVAATSNGIEINFMHYPNFDHAKELWCRRSDRLLEHRHRGLPTRFKLCDREGASAEQLNRFRKMTNGVAFSKAEPQADSQWIQISESKDGVALYRDRYRYFDFIKFIKTGEISRSSLSKLAGILGRQ